MNNKKTYPKKDLFSLIKQRTPSIPTHIRYVQDVYFPLPNANVSINKTFQYQQIPIIYFKSTLPEKLFQNLDCYVPLFTVNLYKYKIYEYLCNDGMGDEKKMESHEILNVILRLTLNCSPLLSIESPSNYTQILENLKAPMKWNDLMTLVANTNKLYIVCNTTDGSRTILKPENEKNGIIIFEYNQNELFLIYKSETNIKQ